MQSLSIIHRFQEIGNPFLDIREVPVFPEVNFFRFQGLEETLGGGVVVRVAFPGHTDLKTADLKPSGVIAGCILHPAVGMVDYSRSGVSSTNGHIQGDRLFRSFPLPAGHSISIHILNAIFPLIYACLSLDAPYKNPPLGVLYNTLVVFELFFRIADYGGWLL